MAAYPLPEGFSDFDMITFGLALLVEGLLGFCLNSVAGLSFLLVKDQRTPSNFLVFNLNIADLMLNINALIAAYASYVRVWPFGIEGCHMHGFLGSIAIYATIPLLALIARDKYHYWCTQEQLSWSTSGMRCASVWVAAVFWAALPLPVIGWGEFNFEPMGNCCCLDYTKGDWGYISYMLAVTVIYLLTPMMIMHNSYAAINTYFKKTHSFKFNTYLPETVLLATWGPFALLCFYAAVENVTLVSPWFRMVIPVWAKSGPIFHAVIYSFTNETYRGAIWKMLKGGQNPDKSKMS
ncbi:RPE-retinal G protein-coupled receptor-like [Engraulis encrasicolus]|uniref:RPE-retinal G protein-coupled receptor-like n=1 Tax=Engraulis encrasicolus TaxID=184585 RepID=UPI002FD02136